MAYQHIFRYRHFIIHKDQILGHGSYGAVYKARCDQLTCAAKILHPTIVDPYDPGSGMILQRFQQECDFLNHIRHPNIVQYLGMCQDPESNLPVLLMELLDSSLTKMLECSPHPIPYHIQVDLCSDVSLAVAYLHSNGIIHRDLSGNNVLVIAGRRAKVTDFGMSKLTSSEHHFTALTLAPGTLGYMSPESLKEPPRYTEKLDVFSQGVIMIQVCTQQFPNPGPTMKEIDDPRSPTGSIHVPLLESERRKKHIDMIDPTHPLLPIALACLEYRERDRPSAEEVCQRLAALKERHESSQHTTPATSEVNETLQQERDKLARQVDEKIKEIATKDKQIALFEHDNITKDHQIAVHQQEIQIKAHDLSSKNEQIAAKNHENEGLREKLRELNQKLADNEQVIAQFQETNQQLQRQIRDLQRQSNELSQQQPVPKPRTRSTEVELEFKWKHRGKSPFKDYRQSSVVERNVAYFSSSEKVYSFDSSTGRWNTRLPPCPHGHGSLANIQGLLTMVGGVPTSDWKAAVNKLLSSNNGGKWIEQFPPMPTRRCHTTAITYKNHLIVAGGSTTVFNSAVLDKVEVFNTDTLVWSTAASLPEPFANGSATICGDLLYILGGNDKSGSQCRSVFSCLLSELLQSCHRPTQAGPSRLTKPSQLVVWQRITDTPMYRSTCATVRGQLVAVGGRGDSKGRTTAVYKYNQNTRSWSIISHMTIHRSWCYVAVIDTNEMLVVSGLGKEGRSTDDVERASF